MNKKTKQILAVIAAVCTVAALILAVIVRVSTPDKPGLIIQTDRNTVTISWDDLEQTSFSGEIVNGKGEVSEHEYQGTELIALLQANGIEINADTKITASSEDNYTAELSGAEVMSAGKVYVAVISDGEMIESIDGKQGSQLVVYGDANAKRQVRYLKIITVE